MKHNFAGAIAADLCHQIWPDHIGSTRMLSLGTGVAEASDDQTPHFRNVFRDSFVRRGFDAWMSTMDTESDWKRYKNQSYRQGCNDSHRLNVSLRGMPSCLDAVGKMEEYRNLVLLQPGSARMAREAATMLLASRFFFVIGDLPENTAAPFWCRGTIRCKGAAQNVTSALERLYPDGLKYVTESGPIDTFTGTTALCPSCGCYNHAISLLSRHMDQTLNVFLQSSSKKRWRIGGFPGSVASFVSRQNNGFSFGRNDHGRPSRVPCIRCDVRENPMKGTRRRRESTSSRGEAPKKSCFGK